MFSLHVDARISKLHILASKSIPIVYYRQNIAKLRIHTVIHNGVGIADFHVAKVKTGRPV